MKKELNSKILLDKQGMSFQIESFEQGKIWLLWKHDIDLDLMLFYKTIEGKEGGVFPDYYRQNKDDLGSYNDFPYICLTIDDRPPSIEVKENCEDIRFRKIDNLISEIYILILDFNSSIDNVPVDFTTYDSLLIIQFNAETFVEIPVNSSVKGSVYLICRINNDKGVIKILNESKCISLKEAYKLIPGFNLVCS